MIDLFAEYLDGHIASIDIITRIMIPQSMHCLRR
jgi:hypothetical protein